MAKLTSGPTRVKTEAEALAELNAFAAEANEIVGEPEAVAIEPEIEPETPVIQVFESGYMVVHPLVIGSRIIDTLQPMPADHGLTDEDFNALLLRGAIKRVI